MGAFTQFLLERRNQEASNGPGISLFFSAEDAKASGIIRIPGTYHLSTNDLRQLNSWFGESALDIKY
ncbi:hypothetical protein L0B52_01445 [Suttonella sp. R2A3]|uniref:hypothetical protein n=1 Tax=Suttonella sp. R2A3 TaxID=2908648 RepID=UPI001F414BB9|nr:hypothetical protein [Suttonella sp. R2A3]UJF24829.1 hypothetical protein L0B52_01445 [Suttonella sp. R2A3]